MLYVTQTIVFLVGLCVGHLPCESALFATPQPTIQACLAERDRRRAADERNMAWHCAVNPSVEGVDE